MVSKSYFISLFLKKFFIRVGETAGSLCGGQPGVADRFIDSLWWMDQLGLLGLSEQTTGQVRQTLSGSDCKLYHF